MTMRYLDDRTHLQVEIVTKECDLPADERARMQALLAPLGEAVRDFPASELQVQFVHHPRSGVYHARFRLRLPGQTLFAGEQDSYLDSAFQRGMDALLRNVQAYRDNPDERAAGEAARRIALDRNVVAPEDPAAGTLAQAIQDGDYRKFRTALAGYEDWLRTRIGRWVQRFPEAEAQIGTGLLLGDLVEEVYLNAFEQFTGRPTAMSLSEWLDGLVDPSLKALLRHPDEEKENASLARTVREAPLG